MSGSGGYASYRCKHFATHECPNWVLVKNTACMTCVSEKREDVGMPPAHSFGRPYEVCVPVVHQGTITYTIMMEQVQPSRSGQYWAMRRKITQQPPMPVITTSDTPGNMLAPTGMGTHSYLHSGYPN